MNMTSFYAEGEMEDGVKVFFGGFFAKSRFVLEHPIAGKRILE